MLGSLFIGDEDTALTYNAFQKDLVREMYISNTEEAYFEIDQIEYSTPPEPLCPVLRATHSVERAIFLFR